ncbi:MAG: triose-phosphate isomerase [Pseudomonadota bacterium]|uniref:triose-phosphate isomerase n=1 Tax=Gallaecimonas pentaromativorans TaxID=584787 RepID=UPI00067ED4CA|nr:triose-phosphate isomerase [Gallaecimonas pentaromativorans]MED5525784.1 triose-phosphate isomerase [Pseudomonadota bacterium]
MRRPLVMGNWKLHGTKASVEKLLVDLMASTSELKDVDIAVCPPVIFINQAEQLLHGANIEIGAQNIDVNRQGAFTGEIAADMLGEFGVKYVLVGHSERRAMHHENDDLVARKFEAVKEAGLIPVLCVGETQTERHNGETKDVIGHQIQAVIKRCGRKSFENAVVAYEPVWAIGSGQAASPVDAQKVHQFIRELVAAQDKDSSEALRILYGGSVKASNAQALFSMDDVDGALVGGASLDAGEFASIIKAAK